MAGKSKADRLAELEAQRKEIEAEPEDEDDYEYEIGWGDKYARVHSRSKAGRKLAAFFEGSGIDLSEIVPGAAEDDDDDETGEGKPKGRARKPDAKPGEGNVRAFRSGRRIS